MKWVKASRTWLVGLGKEIECPFCKATTSTMNSIKTCPGCGAKWRLRRGKYEYLGSQQKDTNVAKQGGLDGAKDVLP